MVLILEAAAIAFDQMLQEDFSHPITRYLSWYACHKFWKNLPVEDHEKETEPPGDEVNVSLFQVNEHLCQHGNTCAILNLNLVPLSDRKKNGF